MKFEIEKSLTRKIRRSVEGWTFEAGILVDKDYRKPQEKLAEGHNILGTYAGGDIRKTSKDKSGKKISEIFLNLSQIYDIDFLKEPLNERTSEMSRFMTNFLRFATGGKLSVRRVENLLQAVIRNPILRNDYQMRNTQETVDRKGFYRPFFDTAQTFKAIRVKAQKVR